MSDADCEEWTDPLDVLLDELKDAGISVEVNTIQDLVLRPTSAVTPELAARVREHKTLLVAHFREVGPNVLFSGTSDYVFRASKEYLDTVQVLWDLEQEQPGKVRAAAAEVLQYVSYDLFTKRYGRPEAFQGCVLSHLGCADGHVEEEDDAFGAVAGEPAWDCYTPMSPHGYCLPPGTDHPRLLYRNGAVVGLLLQVCDLDWSELGGLVDYCRRHGLEAQMTSDASYHYPGHTFAIILTLKASAANDQDQAA